MRTVIHFLVLMVGSLIVLSGCASAPVENISSPTTTPQQDTVSDAQSSASGNFIFYDSYADW